MHYITLANSSLTPSPRSTSTWFSSQNNLVNTSPQLHHPLGWADIVCSTIAWRHDINNIINHVGCRGTTSTHRHHYSDDLYNHTRMVLEKRLCTCWFPPLLSKLVVSPTTASSDILRVPQRYLRIKNVIDCSVFIHVALFFFAPTALAATPTTMSIHEP
jgi:hypothetical protein